MKKLILTMMIATLLVIPFQGVALAENQEANLPNAGTSQGSDFVPGDIPAEGDMVQSMTPAVHALILAMLNHEQSFFNGSNVQVTWEALYNMLSLYGQMDERSDYIGEQLVMPAESLMDFSSALVSNFAALGRLPQQLSDRMVYDAEIDSYLLVCGNDSLAQLNLSQIQRSNQGTLEISGTLVYLVDGSDLAQFHAVLTPQDSIFGYCISSLDLIT